MFFPASSIIAKHHPDLVELIAALDAHMHSLVGVLVRIDATADMLNVDPDTLARLFRLYEAQGVLTPVVLQLCPDDLDTLQPDAKGGLWCEICETRFDADTCLEVGAYLVQPTPDQPAGLLMDENSSTSRGVRPAPRTPELVRGVSKHAPGRSAGTAIDENSSTSRGVRPVPRTPELVRVVSKHTSGQPAGHLMDENSSTSRGVRPIPRTPELVRGVSKQAPGQLAGHLIDENSSTSRGVRPIPRTPELVREFPRQPTGQPQTASRRNTQRGHALIVGVGGYRDLPQLATTVRDAATMAEFFGSPTGAGFAPARVGLLLEQQATRSAISLALEELARDTKPEDTIVFYFAGHGIRRLGGFEPGEYLCPIDTDGLNLRATAIHADDLSTALRALPARQVVVLLDACYSGGMAAPPKTWESTAFGLSEQAFSRLAGGSGRVVIASSKSDELSWELASLKRGLFTHYLIEGLRGGAADSDGAVRILDLYTYLSSHVPQHERQHPVIKGELDSNFVIVPGNRPRSGH